MKTCNNCANYKPKDSWTAPQRFERIGGVGPLTQTHPPKQRSTTRIRAEQSLALGCACVMCAFSMSSPLPSLVDAAMFIGSASFVVSVALGKENRDTLFNLADRNKDGKLNGKDVELAVNAVLDKVLEPDENHTPAMQSTTDNITYGYAVDRMMPDRTLVRAVLLPDYPRYTTKVKLKQCATLYFELDGNENFSKRKCGAPFGDDIAQVQGELERLEYVFKNGKADNAPRQWTAEGERWLEKFLN